MEITKEHLGKATVDVRTSKDGTPTRVEFALCGKDGKQIIQACATSENLRESRYDPVNILQEEEVARFSQFMTGFVNEVNQENQEFIADLERQANKNAGGAG